MIFFYDKFLCFYLMYKFIKITHTNFMMKLIELKKDFQNAIKNQEFQVYLQPKVDTAEKLVGAEALIRRVKKDVVIFPDEFISLYENLGFIIQLDLYVMEQVCKLLQNWNKKGIYLPISVNESPKHLMNEEHGKDLLNLLNTYHVLPQFIELEVTEGAVIQDIKIAKKAQARMHELGFLTSMDDFGVGYSSFSMLRSIPIDILKIDQSFLGGLLKHRRYQIILESIIDMAHKLRIKTVMEGVETREEVEYLKEIGCDILQGYFFDQPLPISKFEEKYFSI